MCMPAVCGTCKKITYSGCGMHVEEVLAGVPHEQRCNCASGLTDATFPGAPKATPSEY